MGYRKMGVEIRDKEWVYLETRENLGLDCLGVCVASVETIIVDPKLKGKPRMDTQIHEFVHAFYPDLAEDSVECFASQLSDFMWDIGYRAANKKSKLKQHD